jgi:hypothetical protein
MKTKMMLIALSIVLSATTVFSQSTTFGVRAGFNLFNITGRDAMDDKLENSLKAGFNVGVNAEIPVGIDFYLQPGVLFITKGADDVNGTDNKISINYIEVPVNFLYKPALGTGRLIMGFGPYAAFGIGGKYKPSVGSETDIDFKSPITMAEAASGTLFLKGFDAGANLLFGYEFANHFSAQLNASLGLVKINPEIENVSNGNTSWKNTGFGVSLGYRFGK